MELSRQVRERKSRGVGKHRLAHLGAVDATKPIPGYYRRRLVKGGPWVGVLIFIPCPMDPYYGGPLDRARPLCCLVDGKWSDALDQWTWVAGEPIDAAEYRYLVESAAWDRQFAPQAPAANPRAPVDIRKLPPVF